MKLSIIGTGYVGLVSGVCFSEIGFDVTCIDRDTSKIDMLNAGQMPIWEPGLKELAASNVAAGRLHFTDDVASGIRSTDIVFVAVGTPPRADSDLPDLTALEAVFNQLKTILDTEQLVVIKSTVPVGTSARMQQLLAVAGCLATVASNPEFLREGSAIEDFMGGDRIVAGVSNARDKDTVTKLYKPLTDTGMALFLTTPQSSELIKYAANSLLALKVAYINEIADICEKMGANIRDVATGIGMDKRIGPKFLNAGPGIGGSCFPKDTQALTALARESGSAATIIEAAIESNNLRKQSMVEKISSAMDGDVKSKTIGILGLTFKPNTDDMRMSPSIDIIQGLQAKGANIQAYDPEGMDQAQDIFEAITYVQDMYAAAKGADALVVVTEWDEFRGIDFAQLSALMKRKLVVDLRNIFKRQAMIDAGFEHVSIGRAPVTQETQMVQDLLAV